MERERHVVPAEIERGGDDGGDAFFVSKWLARRFLADADECAADTVLHVAFAQVLLRHVLRRHELGEIIRRPEAAMRVRRIAEPVGRAARGEREWSIPKRAAVCGAQEHGEFRGRVVVDASPVFRVELRHGETGGAEVMRRAFLRRLLRPRGLQTLRRVKVPCGLRRKFGPVRGTGREQRGEEARKASIEFHATGSMSIRTAA